MGYMGFNKVKSAVAKEPGVRDPGAVAATIGRKKYGAKKFNKAASSGKSMQGMQPAAGGRGGMRVTPPMM